MNKTQKNIGYLILFTCCLMLVVSCGRSKTKKLLLQKKWEVYDVTPPAGVFNIEDANRASDLKQGFYKGAWFKFLPDSVFIASFGGKADTGKYSISLNGKQISLYPRHSETMYEQIQIRNLSAQQMEFNTVLANFHLVLHLKSVEP